MSFKPIDNKRDQFRKYIESKGVIDTITKVLMKLLDAPVKPEHPIDFIRDNLGPTISEKLRVEGLEQQLADYKKEVSDLKSQIEEFKAKLDETNKPMINGNIDINKPDEQSMSSPKESEQVKSYDAENAGVVKLDTVAVSVPTNTSNSATAVNGEKIDCNAKEEDKVSSEESKDSNAIALAENAEVAADKIETKN